MAFATLKRTSGPAAERVDELVRVVQELSLARSLEDVQRIVRLAARSLTGADGATFILRDQGMCFYADEDAIEPLWKGQRFPLDACVSGWAMIHRESVVIEDIYADNRVPHEAYRPTFVRSMAMVPIRTIDPIGAIGNYWAARRRPTDHEVQLLQALADSTAVALENVRVYEELEQRVADRTNELAAVNQRLQELDAIRTRFAHAATHELKQPLTVIIGMSAMLAKRLPSAEADLATRIYEAGDRMVGLVNDLLTLAEIESHEVSIERTPLDITDVIVRSVQAFEAAAAEAGVSLLFEIDDSIGVEGDAAKLRQVLDNLISNAIKYAGCGAHVAVRLRRVDGGAEVEVADDGPGIAKSDRGRLFDPFFRAASARSQPGSGLGLNISRAIAEAHGGTLTLAESASGTTFLLRLPAAAD
jgi:signal transduction histidine kinase